MKSKKKNPLRKNQNELLKDRIRDHETDLRAVRERLEVLTTLTHRIAFKILDIKDADKWLKNL
jgi:hypothetical protein